MFSKIIFVKFWQNVKRGTLLEVCIEVDMNKVVISVLQGGVVTQAVLGGLTLYPPVANFL